MSHPLANLKPKIKIDLHLNSRHRLEFECLTFLADIFWSSYDTNLCYHNSWSNTIYVNKGKHILLIREKSL